MSTAMDDLQYLMNFNSSICRAAAKTMEHLSEFVFISMENLTLTRRDAYSTNLKMGVKPNTLAALHTAPMHISTLFPDSVIKRAEEEIAHFESKGDTSGSRGKGRYHLYGIMDKRSDRKSSYKPDKSTWKNIGRGQHTRARGKQSSYSSRPAKGQQLF